MTSLSAIFGVAFLCSEVGLAWRRRSAREPASRQMDDGSLTLLWRVIGVSIAVGITLAAMNVGPRLPLGIPWAEIGFGIFLAGTALRWWAMWYLGKSFTVDVAVAVDQVVVTTGPYRWIRHPSYTGLLLQFLALAIALLNWLSLAVVLAPVTWALLHRIRVEERALSATLGEPYQRYTRKTKRLIPLVY